MGFDKEGSATRSLRRILGVAGAALAAVTVSASSSSSYYPPASNVSQHADVETAFVNGIDRTKLKDFLHAYASKPHPAGSCQDYLTAVYTKQQFEKFGLKAEIQEYYPLLSEPKRVPRVAITAPASNARVLNLTEGVVAGDKCTTEKDALPPYFAYSPSGNVSAPVVYVNYGRLDDFKWLVDNGVELKGKIALARSGKNFRGLKAMSAEDHGMIGTLIYNDPQDDGYTVGATYPNGPWRPADSFQRGSMEYVSMYSGDPLTPGFASVKGAPYLKIDEVTNIPKAPTTTLSYGQAIHILKSLGGTKAPAAWQGTLALSDGYHIGDDGATEVNLDIDMDNRVRPIWNVIGTIEGAEEPDQSVILGNHRDGWVCGAVDPSSGTSTMLEIARNYGKLLKQGWRPRRTIKIASWDGEEIGLLGSTEFAEDHREELLKGAVAYINVDLTFGPTISAGATPAVTDIMFETAKAVPANKFYGTETETTMYEQWFNQAEAARKANPAMDTITLAPEHMVVFLGSGSDYTPFYQHLGIVSVDFMYAYPQKAYGTYHSTMDSIAYLENLADPNYTAQQTTAQWWGLLAMRLATRPILPLNFTTYGITMNKDLNNWETRTKALGLAIDYSRLRSSIDHFTSKAYEFSNSTVAFKAAYDSGKVAEADVKKLNQKLVQLERQFIISKGLPHRPWYRHVIFGPGFFEGYVGTAFPGISDAVAFNDNATTIQAHVDEVAVIVQSAGDFLIN